jgi:hypothetical protein
MTGVKLSSDDVCSPPSGASMIHSIEPPLKVAGVGIFAGSGGASVMLMDDLLVLFIMMMWPETCAL